MGARCVRRSPDFEIFCKIHARFVIIMHMIDGIDRYDTKILAHLQTDATMTNQVIGEAVGLSASQVSRRRLRLEQDGVIRQYRAILAAEPLGFHVSAIIGVSLSRHSGDNARKFRRFVSMLPEMQEAHAMTGDMDYLLKVIVRDLKHLNRLINDDLLVHEAVDNVRSSIILETLADSNTLPI